jgi:hypothetical protein
MGLRLKLTLGGERNPDAEDEIPAPRDVSQSDAIPS